MDSAAAIPSPSMLRRFAALVQAECDHFADAVSEPARTDLVRAFRGGATPTIPIADFLEGVQLDNLLFEESIYILAAEYLARFIHSRAAREAGILVEPATAHRLVSVTVLLGAKFCRPMCFDISVDSFQIWSHQAIQASEMRSLEILFLWAIDCRIFITDREFKSFSRIMLRGLKAPNERRWSKKRKAKAVAGQEEEEPRRARVASKFGVFSCIAACLSVRSLH